MRERRILLGLTQQQLTELIGVTYKQAHKYEKGVNRIAAGRLSSIARALGVTIRGRPQEACFTRGREQQMLGSG